MGLPQYVEAAAQAAVALARSSKDTDSAVTALQMRCVDLVHSLSGWLLAREQRHERDDGEKKTERTGDGVLSAVVAGPSIPQLPPLLDPLPAANSHQVFTNRTSGRRDLASTNRALLRRLHEATRSRLYGGVAAAAGAGDLDALPRTVSVIHGAVGAFVPVPAMTTAAAMNTASTGTVTHVSAVSAACVESAISAMGSALPADPLLKHNVLLLCLCGSYHLTRPSLCVCSLVRPCWNYCHRAGHRRMHFPVYCVTIRHARLMRTCADLLASYALVSLSFLCVLTIMNVFRNDALSVAGLREWLHRIRSRYLPNASQPQLRLHPLVAASAGFEQAARQLRAGKRVSVRRLWTLVRDALEVVAVRAVCETEITLSNAQQRVLTAACRDLLYADGAHFSPGLPSSSHPAFRNAARSLYRESLALVAGRSEGSNSSSSTGERGATASDAVDWDRLVKDTARSRPRTDIDSVLQRHMLVRLRRAC